MTGIAAKIPNSGERGYPITESGEAANFPTGTGVYSAKLTFMYNIHSIGTSLLRRTLYFSGVILIGMNSIVIDGLWALSFPPSTAPAIDPNRLYFSAGPGDEKDGLFGYLSKQ